jgi:hypothetical protein
MSVMAILRRMAAVALHIVTFRVMRSVGFRMTMLGMRMFFISSCKLTPFRPMTNDIPFLTPSGFSLMILAGATMNLAGFLSLVVAPLTPTAVL